MENLIRSNNNNNNNNNNCVMRLGELPVGYRFCPTDEELIQYYLKRKVFDLPLPLPLPAAAAAAAPNSQLIPDFHHHHLFRTHPSALPGDLKEKRFFFTKQRRMKRKRRRSVVGCGGIWKSIGKEKFIRMKNQQQLLGIRKSFVFHESNRARTTATRWVMHEYRLPHYSASASPSDSAITTPNSTDQLDVGDWAVYCLFQKRRRPKKQTVAVEEQVVVDQEEEDPCSSCSSGLTELSSNATTDQEENSSALGLGLGLGLGFSSSYS